MDLVALGVSALSNCAVPYVSVTVKAKAPELRFLDRLYLTIIRNSSNIA